VFIDRSVDNASTVVYRLPGLRAPQRRHRRRRSRSAGRQAQPLFGEQGGPGCGADRAQKWHDDEQLQLEQGASGVLQAARRAGSVPRLVVAQLRERGTKRQPVSGVVRAGALLPGQDAVLTGSATWLAERIALSGRSEPFPVRSAGADEGLNGLDENGGPAGAAPDLVEDLPAPELGVGALSGSPGPRWRACAVLTAFWLRDRRR
jgi:hypothetical protein